MLIVCIRLNVDSELIVADERGARGDAFWVMNQVVA